MRIYYREHKSSLEEAVKTEKVFESFEKLQEYLESEFECDKKGTFVNILGMAYLRDCECNIKIELKGE